MGRFLWAAAALAWMGVIWFFSDQPNLSSGLTADWWLRKGAHITEYAVLTVLLFAALRGKNWKTALAGAVVIAILYAALDERHQTWIEGRSGNLKDVGIDTAGALLAAVIVITKKRA